MTTNPIDPPRRKSGPPKGNRFWEMRSSHGPDPKFKSGADLWSACCEYFEWVEDNPLTEMKAFHYQGEVTQEPMPKMRAMTLEGLYLFLDISRSTWFEWRSRDDISNIVEKVEETIRSQKFAGAAADLLNANIIARDLGLADKQDIKQESKVVEIATTMSPEDAAKAYTEMMEGK